VYTRACEDDITHSRFAYEQSVDGKNSLYLAILKSTQQPNSAEAMKIVDEYQLSSKTFGVFTHCDELAAPGLARKSKEWVLDPSKSECQTMPPW